MPRDAMRPAALLLGCAIVAACTSRGDMPDVERIGAPSPISSLDASGPPDAAPGTCWGRDETPARVETVTEDVIVSPAILGADGSIVTPAVTHTNTRQQILEERREVWFETPCPNTLTPDVIASLQRALSVRGYFDGDINGQADSATRSAVRRFQQPQGLNSSVLSLAAARQLGLVPVKQAPTSSLNH